MARHPSRRPLDEAIRKRANASDAHQRARAQLHGFELAVVNKLIKFRAPDAQGARRIYDRKVNRVHFSSPLFIAQRIGDEAKFENAAIQIVTGSKPV